MSNVSASLGQAATANRGSAAWQEEHAMCHARLAAGPSVRPLGQRHRHHGWMQLGVGVDGSSLVVVAAVRCGLAGPSASAIVRSYYCLTLTYLRHSPRPLTPALSCWLLHWLCSQRVAQAQAQAQALWRD